MIFWAFLYSLATAAFLIGVAFDNGWRSLGWLLGFAFWTWPLWMPKTAAKWYVRVKYRI